MKVVILGCGRVGAMLATNLDNAGHDVSIIDTSNDAFERLDPSFSGQRVVGNGVDEEILRRAGIVGAQTFIAVTNGDNRNIMASQMAKKLFQVENVVCRIYDPRRQSVYEQLGLESICPTLIGVDMIMAALNGKKVRLVPDDTKG